MSVDTGAAQGGQVPTPRTSRSFLRQLTAATGGGMFLDGWVYAAIAAVIAGKTFVSGHRVGPRRPGRAAATAHRPMFATAVFLAVVGLHKVLYLPTGVTVGCFFGYLLFYGLMSILPGIYPIEVFPTAVRTSGEGVASAASRVGAAVGTFVLPISLARFGLSYTLFGLAAVCLAGGISSLWLAPETTGRLLTETGSRAGVGARVAPA